MATACLLSQELAAHGLATGGGATAPPWLVANFGTAGGAAKDWELGQSALVVRLRDDRQGQAIYPERLLRWEGAEAECCTVAQPQRTLPEETSDQTGRGLLFDMEAHAVASATLRFLSTAHLLVGKCVSDHLGEAERSWKELAERCQADYWRASQRFLEHALSHALALWRDPRRRRGEAIAAQSRELLQATLQVLPLTVSQQRELHQHLKARLAACPDAAAYQEAAASYRARLLTAPTPGKSGSKQALTRLLEELRPSL